MSHDLAIEQGIPVASFDTAQRAAVIHDLSETIGRLLSERGYTRAETEIVQPADLFLTRAGDQLMGRLFTFDNRGSICALRPEFTAIAAHSYAKYVLSDEAMPVVRWQFHGPIFERVHESGAIRQSFSAGAELIGDGSLEADVDIIVSALDSLRLSAADDVSLIVGSVALMRALLKQFELDSRTIRFLLTKLDDFNDPERGKATVEAALKHFLGADQPDARSVAVREIVRYASNEHEGNLGSRSPREIALRLEEKHRRAQQHEQHQAAIDFLDRWARIKGDIDSAFGAIDLLLPAADDESAEAFAALHSTIDSLCAAGVDRSRIIIQPGLERSWDYYTGIVFELRSGDRLLGGGGRYDELVRLLGASVDVPAVGFALYLDTIAELTGGATSP